MTTPKSILITAASGNIGGHLVPLLLSQSPQPKIVLPTSSASKLQSKIESAILSKLTPNVRIEEGSVKDPVWFQSLLATHSVDTVLLCLTTTDELFTAMNCLDAISRVSTVKRLIYISISGDFTSDAGFKETVRTRGYPHLFAKVLLEHRLKLADLPFDWTVLGPTVFFSNDYLQKASLLNNSYFGAPLSKNGVNMVNPADIALAARNVMYDTTGTWSRKKIELGSLKTYTGYETKDIWSRALGKPLEAFIATPEGMEDWEQQLRAFMPGDYGKAMARDLRLVYEFLMRSGISINAEQYEEQVALLGKEPDDYEAWVKDTALAWLKE